MTKADPPVRKGLQQQQTNKERYDAEIIDQDSLNKTKKRRANSKTRQGKTETKTVTKSRRGPQKKPSEPSRRTNFSSSSHDLSQRSSSGTSTPQRLSVSSEISASLRGSARGSSIDERVSSRGSHTEKLVTPRTSKKSMIAQELSKLSDQQCLLQDAVTNLNLRVVDALNQPDNRLTDGPTDRHTLISNKGMQTSELNLNTITSQHIITCDCRNECNCEAARVTSRSRNEVRRGSCSARGRSCSPAARARSMSPCRRSSSPVMCSGQCAQEMVCSASRQCNMQCNAGQCNVQCNGYCSGQCNLICNCATCMCEGCDNCEPAVRFAEPSQCNLTRCNNTQTLHLGHRAEQCTPEPTRQRLTRRTYSTPTHSRSCSPMVSRSCSPVRSSCLRSRHSSGPGRYQSQTDLTDTGIRGILSDTSLSNTNYFSKAESPWCWRILRWLLILLFLYFIFFAVAAVMPDRGCPGKSWKWWDTWTPRLTLRSYRPLPH